MTQKQAWQIEANDRVRMPGSGPLTVTETIHHDDRTVTVRGVFEDGREYARQVSHTATYRMATPCVADGCDRDVTNHLYDTCDAHEPVEV